LHSDQSMSATLLRSSRRLAGAAIVIAILCGGCESAHVPESVIVKFPGNDADAQLGFWHELASRHLTSNDDAFHGLLLYLNGKDDSTNYAQRVETLKSRGMLPNSFAEPGDVAVRRGILAIAVAKILEIRGGWAMHVFGPTQRYATRELVYDDVFPPSSAQQTFSGSEYVGIIGKIEDYQRSMVTVNTAVEQ
jgi:hypothetical protein